MRADERQLVSGDFGAILKCDDEDEGEGDAGGPSFAKMVSKNVRLIATSAPTFGNIKKNALVQRVILERVVKLADPRRIDLFDVDVAPIAEELVPSFAEQKGVFTTAPALSCRQEASAGEKSAHHRD